MKLFNNAKDISGMYDAAKSSIGNSTNPNNDSLWTERKVGSSGARLARKPLLDTEWAGRAFLAPAESLTNEVDEYRRYFTTSSRKFVSSALGGHFCVNPLPQFTANADLAHPAFFTKGLDIPSRFWSEKLDDYSQFIHFRPGVPRFNSLTTFFGNFYNVEMGAISRTGRAPGFWYKVGKAAAIVGTLPLQPFIWGGAAMKFFLETPRSKYYYLHPTPFPYRMAVQTIMNTLMANMGFIVNTPSIHDPEGMTDDAKKNFIGDDADKETIKRVYGPLKSKGYINEMGGFDILAISTSSTTLANQFKQKLEQAILDNTSAVAYRDGGVNPENERELAMHNILGAGVANVLGSLTVKPITHQQLQEEWEGGKDMTDIVDSSWTEGSLHIPPPPKDKEEAGIWDAFTNYIKSVVKQFKSEAYRGSDFVTFRVNWTGPQSESFNNQPGESSLSSKINSMSAKARDIRFSTADGNLIGGITGKAIGAAAGAIKDLMTSFLDGIGLSGLVALGGTAFADIQKTYQSSSASLNRTDFTLHLRSWAADDFVRMQNLFLPLAHILALGLPRATGPGSYDSPFLVEVFNQGKSIIREGMIESISIERGVGDVGFGKNMEVLGIDVTVTVVDMSSILSMPIATAVSSITSSVAGGLNYVGKAFGGDGTTGDTIVAGLNKNTYSEDNQFSDYMATLSSLPLDTIMEPRRKWKLRMARMRSDMASQRTASNLGSAIFNGFMPSETIKMFLGGMPKR